LGTPAEWSEVARFVAAIAVGFMLLELFLELIGLRNKPRESLVYPRYGILFSLLFSMIHTFRERKHGNSASVEQLRRDLVQAL